MAMICKQCDWCARHVGTINVVANAVLLVVKLIGGILGMSQALIADAVHSLDDVTGSVVLLIGLKVSVSAPDEHHHWGHGNIEFIVSLIIGTFLICVSTGIVIVAVTTIVQGTAGQPGILAVGAAAISMALNELLYRQSLCIGQQVDSPAMIANAWENRGDVLTSGAAFIGAFGARLGFTFLDPLAALVVAFMLVSYAIKMLCIALRGILDHSGDTALITRLQRTAARQEGVVSVGGTSIKTIGQQKWVYIEVRFPPEMKLSESRKIVARLRQHMLDELGTGNVAQLVIIPRASQPALEDVR